MTVAPGRVVVSVATYPGTVIVVGAVTVKSSVCVISTVAVTVCPGCVMVVKVPETV